MKEIEVIIQEDGKTAKELNPFACYGTQKPHPMDFDDAEEFENRLHKWYEAEENLKSYDIESVTNTLGEVLIVSHFQLFRIAGAKERAEVLENGKLRLLWK